MCFIYVSANAQPTLDTIMYCLKKKPQLFGKLDTRNSFISNSRAKIFGIKFGLNYGNRVHLGLGYNQLYPPASDFDKKVYFSSSTTAHDSANATLKLFYISAQAEYVYFQSKQWLLSIPLQIGVGETFYQFKTDNIKYKIEKNVIFIYEPAVSVEYKFVQWAGVGVDTGFRFMVTDYRRLTQKFSSPTYAFKLLIYYNEIYKTVTKKIKKK